MRTLLRKVTELPLWGHGALAIGSVAWFQWAKGKLDASYAASGHPVDYMTGQTGFNADAVKGYYAAMQEAGTLDVYVTTQLIDFAFILGFLGIGLFVCTLIARLSRDGSFGRKAGLLAGASFIIGGICDMIENGWSFVMLADPANFPDWLAIAYSSSAVLKFGFITAGMGLVIVSVILAATGRVFGKPRLG